MSGHQPEGHDQEQEQPTAVRSDAAFAPATPSATVSLPRQIGQYRPKRVIGHGGMGTIFEAVQEHPRRVVALKVMNSGVVSPAALRRFEYESQILARLRHPGIAQVYEAGTHDDGRGLTPYFAMEYISGARTITSYADAKSLSATERLELFTKVCEAVHHGHQKGIIHRDLKPANILVDSSGQPKIIDFGIARGTDSEMAMPTLQTQIGDLVGTLPYMSPEQCDADPHDLDTRSDVYSLGIVLYELLCGTLPYDVSQSALYEATRVIRDMPPQPLSGHNPQLKGDVETIVHKALAKDRERRYQSAHDLMLDIRRYLNREPIAARPPSLTYQFKMFTRRNKALMGSAAVVLAVLVLGIIGTSAGMLQAKRAQAAEAREAETAKDVVSYFLTMFRSLDPRGAEGRDARVMDLLDDFAGTFDSELGDQPAVAATLQAAIGNAYKNINVWEKAETQLRQALATRKTLFGDVHPDVAQTTIDLASVLWFKGEAQEAERLGREALELWRQIEGPESENIAYCLNHIAACVDNRNRHEEAEQLYRQALEMYQSIEADDEHVARANNNLATCLFRQERYEEAIPLYEEAVEVVRSLHGPDHVDVARGLSSLGRCLNNTGRHEDALRNLEHALAMKREILGEEDQSTAVTEFYLAEALYDIGRVEEAEAMCSSAHKTFLARFQPSHFRVTQSTALLEKIREAQGR